MSDPDEYNKELLSLYSKILSPEKAYAQAKSND